MLDDHLLEFGDDGVLLCPICGSINLNHQSVEVSNRRGEDREGGLLRVTLGKEIEVERLEAEQFQHGRRDHVSCSFYCEGCSQGRIIPFILVLRQHKGSTYLGWTSVSERAL